jgi:uncharacterized membrane protein
VRIWFIPMAYVAGAIAGGVSLPRLEHQFFPSYLNDISVNSALAFLSSIASGMMALTAIVFSIAYVTAQFNAIAYSPRLALWFARDRVMFHTFGLFMATFIYALWTMNWIDRGGSGGVPLFSGFVVAGLLVVSMFMFTRLVRTLASTQVTNMLHLIGDRGRVVISEMFRRAGQRPDGPRFSTSLSEAPELGPARQEVRYHGQPNCVGRFDVEDLVQLVRQADGVIEIACAVGDTVVDGTLLLTVHRVARPLPETSLRRAIHLLPERTFEQDPKYPIRLLVDIAIKALSPAINDPTTAVQAIDQIEDLLHRLAQVDLEVGAVCDADGVLRLLFPVPSWEDYLRLAFDEIRHYGAGSVQVLRRLRSALAGVAEAAADHNQILAVQRYVRQLDFLIESSTLDAEDRAVASQEDRQGLGVSRKRAGVPASSASRPPHAQGATSLSVPIA